MQTSMIRRMRDRPLYLILPVAALALAAWAFWPRALPVEVTQATRAALDVGFSEEGRTRLRTRFQVTAPVDGFLQRIRLEPGDSVAAGEPVATLLPVSARLLDPAAQSAAETRLRVADKALLAAEAMLASARAQNIQRQAALSRAESLLRNKMIAMAERDQARAEASASAASEQSAMAHVEEARAVRDGAQAELRLQGSRAITPNSKPLVVRAPAAGRIVQRHVESEGPIAAGQPLLDIGNPADLEVVVEILSADAIRIAPGTLVQLAGWGGGTILPGRVRKVEPGAFTKVSALGVEEQRVRAIVTLDAPPANRAGLGDGYRVEAWFRVWHSDAVLQVPIAALFRDGERWAVYEVDDKHARLRAVELGRFGEHAAEVRGGLSEGATVVLYPGDAVRDGIAVKTSKPPRR